MKFKISWSDKDAGEQSDYFSGQDEESVRTDFLIAFPGSVIKQIEDVNSSAKIEVHEDQKFYSESFPPKPDFFSSDFYVNSKVIELSNGAKIKIDSNNQVFELAWQPIAFEDLSEKCEIRIMKNGKELTNLPKGFEIQKQIWLESTKKA